MWSTIPAMLFCMATPATQAAELRTLCVVSAKQEPAPSIGAALSAHELGPTEMGDRLFGQVTWLTDASDARPVMGEIEAYRDLAPGWDGAAGRPALQWSIDAAIAYVAALPPDVRDPVPMISPMGELGLYWMEGPAYAEIGFDDAGACFMFAEAPGKSPVHFDDFMPGDFAVMATLRGIMGFLESAPVAA